jgi:hypothetical protein
MKRAIIAVVMWAAPLSAANPFEDAHLTMDSFGPLKVGMTLTQAQQVAGEMRQNLDGSDECQEWNLLADSGIWLMVENDKVTRLAILDSHHTTVEGIRIGDSEEVVRAAYGHRLEVEAHTYSDEGHYLVVRSKDMKSALVFETDGKHITSMRGGRVPAVEYEEGCL